VLTPAEVAERMPGNADNGSAACTRRATGAPSRRCGAALATAARSTVYDPSGLPPRAGSKPRADGSARRHRERDIRTPSVLLAGGAWSSLFCRRHDIELPIGSSMPPPAAPRRPPEITMGALGTDFYCIRRASDGVLRWRCAEGARWKCHRLFRYAKTFWPTYGSAARG